MKFRYRLCLYTMASAVALLAGPAYAHEDPIAHGLINSSVAVAILALAGGLLYHHLVSRRSK